MTSILLATLRQPESVLTLSADQWDQLIRLARKERLLAKLGHLIVDQGLASGCPPQALMAMKGSNAYCAYLQTQVMRELDQVRRTCPGTKLLLLKGAAYIQLGLSVGKGRYLSDLDILISKSELGCVEEQLLSNGWEHESVSDYDQHYYRAWMHELPPLKHHSRSVEVDLHHNLFPPVGCLKIDADKLWQKAVRLPQVNLYTLCSEDRLLHSAVHLFYSDELRGGLRDLFDLHTLCSPLGADLALWEALVDRAKELNLTRPLYYALECCARYLGTAIPKELLGKDSALGQGGPLALLMTRLFEPVFNPHIEDHIDLRKNLLYIRSHWLRMPPLMLFRHLTKKAFRKQALQDDQLPYKIG